MYAIGTQESAMTEKDWVNFVKNHIKSCLMADVELVSVGTRKKFMHAAWGELWPKGLIQFIYNHFCMHCQLYKRFCKIFYKE
jgi:hypothetical protein